MSVPRQQLEDIVTDDKARAEQSAREILKYGKHGGQLQCICAACEENVGQIILRAIRLARAEEAELLRRWLIEAQYPEQETALSLSMEARAAELRRPAEGTQPLPGR